MKADIKKRNKWFYSSGCIGRDMVYTMVSMFLIIYVQYTSGITNAQFMTITGIMVACRVWDAINDPMMGTIITNTRSKYGKYRPWVLIGALTNALCFVSMFCLSALKIEGWNYVIILGVLYLLWGMTFTMNDVSYWSLLPALAHEKKDRDTLTTLVAVFASVGAFAAGGLILMFTTGDAVMKYMLFAIVFAIIFIVCQIMVFVFVREDEDKGASKEKITLKGMFKVIFNNKQLVYRALVVLGYSLGSALLNAFGQNYFYLEFGYDGSPMLIFTVVYAIGTLVSQAIFARLAAKYRRAQLTKVGMFTLIAGYLSFFILAVIPFGGLSALKLTLLCLFSVLVFAGQGIFYMNMLVMLANTIEYDQWKTGIRNESIIFSVRPFMVKLAGAFQQLIVSLVLVLSGIKGISDKIAELEQAKAGTNVDITNQANVLLEQVTDTQKFILAASMTLIPIILFIGCYLVIKKKYIIDEDLYEKIVHDIENGIIAKE